jgi:DsbC/DsbD-like thiol-disulfide interchange protein
VLCYWVITSMTSLMVKQTQSRRFLSSLACLILLPCCYALAQTPATIAQWSIQPLPQTSLQAGDKFSVVLSAQIQEGWHVYSLLQAPGGPTPLTVKLEESPAFALHGPPKSSKPESVYDKSFEMVTKFHEHSVELTVPLLVSAKAPAGKQQAVIDVRFQACSDRICLPPSTVHLNVEAEITAGSTPPAHHVALATPPKAPAS